MNRCPAVDHCQLAEFLLFSGGIIVAVSRRFRGQGKDPTYLFGPSPAPTSRSFLPTCYTPLAISQSWFCKPLLSTLLKSNRMFFTAPRLPIHVRWNRWLSGYTSVTAACRSVSWQCCTFAAHEMNFDLGFSMLPWHSMAAVGCQMLLGPRIALSASVPPIPPFRRICLCRSNNLTEHMLSRST